ncbi:tRNA pseudouridine(38-40) synthase TruA [Bacilliculturomica massiliensis]|uniref:tRNA pseudouridine(38-40) synthase TruA n=1 Tax=Bacilliculturomica massiliensis TaxID=1917867 RepID=UPI001031AC5E|nr:tRNA pseudouridine(38-40) synthase TruA [Bacilliculturomica massiliensis]
MKNVLLTISYDGTGFSGWQRQPGRRTVQGELERVLSVLCGQEIQINGTSRTDAGVHALGQRASFKGEFGIPVERMAQAANNLLAAGLGLGKTAVGDVRILEAREVDPEFHARFSSRGKRYVYRIRDSRQPDLFQRNYCYQVRRRLDEQAMALAAEHVVGEHDFRCFMAAGGKEMESTVRRIYGLDVKREGDELLLSVSGNGFLYNMVRIIAGTLTEVGMGRRKPEELKAIIERADRRYAGHTAPPQGLYLMEVFYEDQ